MKPTRSIAKYLALYSAAFLIVARTNRWDLLRRTRSTTSMLRCLLYRRTRKNTRLISWPASGKVAALTGSYDKKDYGR